MKFKSIIAMCVAVAVACLPTGQVLATAQQVPTEEKQYVVVSENEAAYEEAAEVIGESVTMETPVLAENHVIVAQLDAAEIKELERNEDILVEEDIIVTASTAEDADARKLTKEEVIRLKQERHAQSESSEKAAEESEPEYEWNIQAVHADGVAEETERKERAKVAVLDSGVDYVSGVNLKGFVNLVEEEEYLPEMFQDLTGHGTGIAGIIAGSGESGVYGVNPDAEVYSVRVLDEENKAPLSRIIQGIYWCVEHDINIINMSFGTSAYSRALETAVEDAYAANILMIAAAGNDGSAVEYPAAFEEVMAVAAADTSSQLSDFSNTGEELEVAAPGEKIRTTGFFNGNVVTHGTSIAVPHVTGAASLLWEKDLSKSNAFIRALINRSTRDMEGTDECGLLDTEYALGIYDAFADSYQEEDQSAGETIPENAEKAESFEYVDDDESYVEGRWGGRDHKNTITNGVTGISFTSHEIQWLKDGIVYPDSEWRSDQGEKLPKHQAWHGHFKYRAKQGYRVGEKINYAAVVEMVTEIALANGNTSKFTDYKEFSGMDPVLFNDLKATIQGWYNKKISWVEKHRKFFLYGCGLHTLTDLFAHSSADKNNKLITHAGGSTDADSIEYYDGRYNAASKAVEEALRSLHDGVYTDGLEIIYGLKQAYKSNSTFHIVNLKKNLADNGCGGIDSTLINKVNVDDVNLK